MKHLQTCALALFLAAIVGVGSGAFGSQQSQPEKLSRKMTAKVSIIGAALGAGPKDYFSAQPVDVTARPDVAEKMLGGGSLLAAESFPYLVNRGAGDADVCGFDVKDGRIHRIGLLWKKTDDRRIARILEKLAADAQVKPGDLLESSETTIKTAQADVLVTVRREGAALYVGFSVHPADWLRHHSKVSDEIAAGLKDRKWVEGMTDEMGIAVNDGPGVYMVVGSPFSPPANDTASISGGQEFRPGFDASGSDIAKLTESTIRISADSRSDASAKAENAGVRPASVQRIK